MAPCAKFTLMCREPAVDLVRRMEENCAVAGNTFKVLEAMVLRENFERLIYLGKMEKHPNAQQPRSMATGRDVFTESC